MGKRAMSQNKINKNNNIPCNKKQLNNLIKLLKPKVYITSCSNFKNLVQQLTGNESIHHESSVSEHPTQNLTIHESESHLQSINQELSLDSLEGAMPSSFTTHHESSIQKYSPKIIFSEEYKKMESWLLEIDTCSNYHHYEGNVPLVQEQVSLCDNYDSYLSNILHY